MTLGRIAAGANAGRARRLSVLVIDDDSTQRMLVGATLGAAVDVLEAQNGLAGVGALEEGHFDLAICDLDMPDMDGFGVIERARARPQTRHLPIIIVTGRDDVVAIERAFALGATSFLCKPINWGVFRHQVEYVLKVAETERELRAGKEHADWLAAVNRRGLAVVEREMGQVIATLGAAAHTSPDACSALAGAAARLQATLLRIGRAAEILTGPARLALENVEAVELAGEVLERLRSMVGPERVGRVTLDVPRGLSVLCDRDMASTALAEVVRNAVIFSPDDRPVDVRALEVPPDCMRFEIADRGPGIPDELISMQDARLPPLDTEDAAPPRMKLGLPMARAIMNRHGGHFGIMAEPGRGTEVFLTFPNN